MKQQLFNVTLRVVRSLPLGFMFWASTACAAGSDVLLHTFKFDAKKDSPGIRILDYRYGDSAAGPTRAATADVLNDRVRQAAHVGGYFRRGDSLYVKWRLESTGEVLEDTVDLKSRLQRDLTNHILYFVVHDRLLIVYLVARELKPPAQPAQGPEIYQDYTSYVVYPDHLSTLNTAPH